MLEALKVVFRNLVRLNVALSPEYVSSAENPADAPSRRLSDLDCSLSHRLWLTVQRDFGGPIGHTCDLMALDPMRSVTFKVAPSHISLLFSLHTLWGLTFLYKTYRLVEILYSHVVMLFRHLL